MLWVLVLIMVKSDVPSLLEVDHTSLARCQEAGKVVKERIDEEYEGKLGAPTVIWACVKK